MLIQPASHGTSLLRPQIERLVLLALFAKIHTLSWRDCEAAIGAGAGGAELPVGTAAAAAAKCFLLLFIGTVIRGRTLGELCWELGADPNFGNQR